MCMFAGRGFESCEIRIHLHDDDEQQPPRNGMAEAHVLESWSDARTRWSVAIQRLSFRPLFGGKRRRNGRALIDAKDKKAYDIVTIFGKGMAAKIRSAGARL